MRTPILFFAAFLGSVPFITLIYGDKQVMVLDDLSLDTFPLGMIMGVTLLTAMSDRFDGDKAIMGYLVFASIILSLLTIFNYGEMSNTIIMIKIICSALAVSHFLMAVCLFFTGSSSSGGFHARQVKKGPIPTISMSNVIDSIKVSDYGYNFPRF